MLYRLDWPLLAGVLVLIAAGLLVLASSDVNLFYRQLLWLGGGIAAAVLLASIDWRPFLNYKSILLALYALLIFLLLLTLFFAPQIRGSRAWFSFYGFRFQPSEFMKIVLILIYANFFRRAHVSIANLGSIVQSFLYLAVPAALILWQPDMGSVLTLAAIWAGFLLVSGIRLKHLFIGLLIIMVASVFLWQSILAPYQKARILGFLGAEQDPLGVGYNVIQSKIAIGSAGWWGKGFGQGTQVQLGFLPEAKTDFILAAFIEEWGLLAGVALIGVFLFVIFRTVRLGIEADNNFNRFLCLGAVLYWLVQFVLNVGSTVGLTPVIGVTFPFMSYGGSSLLTNLILLGILESVAIRRSYR